MNFVEQLQEQTREDALSFIKQRLVEKALTRMDESNPIAKIPGRYYIHDKSGNVVGNPKGYANFKAADKQQNMRGSPAHKSIWDEFYRHENAGGKQNNLVSSIKLHEEVEDQLTITEADVYGYHPSNPKIDLHHKETGEYIASTNWAKNTKQAVQKYEEKNPHMAGKVGALYSDRGMRARRNVNESSDVSYTANPGRSGGTEGAIHPLYNWHPADIEGHFKLPRGSVDTGDEYSDTATVTGSDGSVHHVYAHGRYCRVRPIEGKATPEQTQKLMQYFGA